jgi:hypothetical protein
MPTRYTPCTRFAHTTRPDAAGLYAQPTRPTRWRGPHADTPQPPPPPLALPRHLLGRGQRPDAGPRVGVGVGAGLAAGAVGGAGEDGGDEVQAAHHQRVRRLHLMRAI